VNSWLSLPLAALAILPLAAQTGKSLLEQDASGWIDIMPGPSLKGWTRLPIAPDPLAPESQWKVQNGVLICEGDKGHDWIRFDREFTDFVFHVEFRYTPIAGNPRYNSGIFIRSAADYSSWFQVQIGSSQGGYLFGRGPDGRRFTTADRTPDQTLVKPAGEWNVVETTVQGPVARVWVNGAELCEYRYLPLLRGFLGLEGEGFRIEFRNLKVKPLPGGSVQ
jgi:hypothetical protein